MNDFTDIAVLGGGPAGLGAGYFLQELGFPFQLFEAANRVGGNCVTLERSGFRFDTGAHRFHDKDPEITKMVQDLMGPELLRVDAPSAIYTGGRYVDFPLTPFNLLKMLGPREVFFATIDWLVARKGSADAENFEKLAVNRYGRRLADRFLLNYSEKLWGQHPSRLSVSISGGRLKGLTLKTFLLEGVRGRKKKTAHLDGTFLYPKTGYGAIVERLADACGREQIQLGHRITRIKHRGYRIESIVANDEKETEVNRVVNTLPLPLFIAQMDPPAPPEILEACKRIQFRDVLLVGLLLNRPRVMNFATLYFPSPDVPFTRVYEPINRSIEMSPEGKTSLFIEIAMPSGQPLSDEEKQRIVDETAQQLCETGMISPEDIQETFTLRLPKAYPVLEVGIEDIVAQLTDYLSGFENLVLSGRNGRFQYAHLHDMLRWGKEAAARASQMPGPVFRETISHTPEAQIENAIL